MYTLHYDKEGNVVAKDCASCKQILPITCFRQNIRKSSGVRFYASYCKECQKQHDIACKNRKRESGERKVREKTDWSIVTEKCCNKCNRVLPVSAFSPQKVHTPGACPYQHWCKECMAYHRRNRSRQSHNNPYRERIDQSPFLAEGKKQCSKCEKVLPLFEFYKQDSGVGGRYPVCRYCRLDYVHSRHPIVSTNKNTIANTLATGKKHCGRCQTWKSVEEFVGNRNNPDGCEAWCKACKAEYARTYQRNRRREKGIPVLPRRVPDERGYYPCSVCKEYLPQESFNPVRQRGKVGPRSNCKECGNARQRELRRAAKSSQDGIYPVKDV